MTTGYEAFISYASPDLRFAEDAYRRLTAAGFAVWFDKVRLQPGFDWHREIEQACEASRVLLPVLTPHWKLSEWTRFETYGADAVIPLIIDGAPDESFTPPLARFQGHAVDFETLATSATEDNHSRPDNESWKSCLRLFVPCWIARRLTGSLDLPTCGIELIRTSWGARRNSRGFTSNCISARLPC